MAAMAAFTFSSCEDVPEPYTLPTKPEAGGTTQGEPLDLTLQQKDRTTRKRTLEDMAG